MNNKLGKLFIIRDREAGNIIDWFDTKNEAENELSVYETIDKNNGDYSP